MSEGLEVTGEVFESPAQHRVRPGREPPAHDQGAPRRHARELRPGMRILVALGGNALLEARRADDGGRPARQHPHRGHVAGTARRATTSSCCRTATARRSACSPCRPRRTRTSRPYPLDVLGAQTEGMIGYLIEQELGNLLPAEVPLATILTMIEVDADDPGVRRSDQVRRPDLRRRRGRGARRREGLGVQARRRPPAPRRALAARRSGSSRSGRSAGCSDHGVRRDLRRRRRHPDHVGGRPASARSTGVEAVIDKDLASELLAREVDADLFVMATDVDGVYEGWGTPDQRRLDRVTPEELRAHGLRRRARWARRSRPRRGSSRRPASAPRSARSRDIEQIVDGTRRHERRACVHDHEKETSR